ncbi:uncharacterized protein BX663DRAFT_305053 [Cokeromyces recurvatus]|uniref:uncharacterized protein n=1 Tax=Cokeromyces recurvatus TaxID=90255 RepID=UPI0022211242|nr:uncharacterized protein BX663DRAFT_305053 [Cokeromyces recurvatus]KAI7897471.1 hypothetical protein BX663DRAFT_305053 [Cokeromyces recurvatus]
MSIQLNKDQRECKCSTCSQSELGYRVVHRHTARIHQEIDEGLADANAIEQNVYDANDDIIFEDNNAIDAIELEDMDYLEGEEGVDEYEANDNFASNDTKLFNISENEALPYLIMIFLTFFQANNLTITATESLFKFMNAILFLLGINYAFPSKPPTIKSKISANYASKDIKNMLFVRSAMQFIYTRKLSIIRIQSKNTEIEHSPCMLME